MIKSFIFVCFLSFFMTIFPYFTVYADSFSCEGGIVSIDDRSSTLLEKCGPPDFRDSHLEEVVWRLDDVTKQKVFITVEEWTYNLGPNRLTRIIVLKNSEIAEIRTGSYGYDTQ